MQNMLMGPGPAQGAPGQAQQAASPQFTPQQIAEANNHLQVVMKALMGLVAQPQGSLTKKSVFSAAGEMIAEGAFRTPEAKQQLVAQLAELPDDEASIRKAIGAQLLGMGEMADQFAAHLAENPNG